MKKDKDSNGYVLVYKPEHPKAMKGENWDGYVYEHVLIGEETVDRSIKEGEEVHHLDFNRSNNSPDNLLVLPGPMHAKLHGWLEKHTIIPNEQQLERNKKGCIRCATCSKPINHDLIYCSTICYSIARQKESSCPSKEILEKEVQEFPMTSLGEKYGVSDNAVKKWCKKYNIDLPDRRGFWTKKKLGLI